MSHRCVLMIGNFASAWGGTPTATEILAARLRETGWSVIEASPRKSRAARLLNMLSVAWLSRKQYDVATVDVYSGAAFVWAAASSAILTLLRKPYILALHGGGLPEFTTRPLAARVLISMARRSKAVIAQSGYLASCLPTQTERVTIIPNGIDVDNYHPRVRSTPGPEMVWLRAFHHVYNPLLAVEVLAALSSEFPAARLTMLGGDKGDGAYEATLAEAKRLGVTERLILPGMVPKSEVAERLASADIFLNTTNHDNTPVSVEEAMASGLCVVSTAVGGIPYLLTHETNALLVPPEDTSAMADAVRRLLVEDGLAERLSATAWADSQAFGWSRVLPSWERTLREAAGMSADGAGAIS